MTGGRPRLSPGRRSALACLFLVAATVAVYWQEQGFDFVNFDDNRYVVDNRHIRGGFDGESLRWAFTTSYLGNWHPLTWLSHTLDFRLFGDDPRGHHLVNLLLHTANTLLLFFAFTTMTGRLWRSAFLAALFALHPLHVESVAWVSERKDLLSAFSGCSPWRATGGTPGAPAPDGTPFSSCSSPSAS